MDSREIKNYSGNCGPIAVQLLTGRTDGEVLDVCLANGFKRGMTTIAACRSLQMFNKKVTEVDIRNREREEEERAKNSDARNNATFKMDRYGWRARPTKYFRHSLDKPTVRQFAETHQTGSYLITVSGHFLVVIDGKIIDKNFERHKGGTRLRMKVFLAHQVEDIS